MFSIIETIATAILLILLMIFVLHLIRGDAGEWLTSKFRIASGDTDESQPSPVPTIPPISGDLPPLPGNIG